MDKYELLTQMAKALDERDHLREVNDVLERDLHEFKVADSSGQLTPTMMKVYKYGLRKLFNATCNPDWYSIGVKELDGEPYPKLTVNEWFDSMFSSSSIPKELSENEVRTLIRAKVNKVYDDKWEKEVAEWRESNDSEDEED